MSVDKSIDYVNQDGYKNYIKNSDSVTVPKKFKARKGAPGTKLAYITDAEEKQLKKQNPGTPHKGPSNVPSYDSFDAQGSYTSGTAMSAMETGSTNARDRREVQASNIGAPSGAGPGVKTQAEQDLRAAAIAAGAGQRVNPGFFDSRNTVSPTELAAARAISPAAFRATRGGGLGSFFTGGGFLGNIIRAIGNRFGLGKKYNEPTYDMSQFNNLGLLTSRVNPDYYNDLGNEGLLSLIGEEDKIKRFTDMDLSFLKNNPDLQALYERDKRASLLNNKGIMQDLDEIGLTPSGKEVGYVGYDPAESMDISIGRKTPQLGDLTGFIDDFATITARERELKDLFSSNTGSDVAPQFQDMVMQTGINETQKKMIDNAANMYGRVNPGEKLDATTQQEIFDSVKPFDTKAKDKTLGLFGGQEADPMTQQEYKNYLISQGYI